MTEIQTTTVNESQLMMTEVRSKHALLKTESGCSRFLNSFLSTFIKTNKRPERVMWESQITV